MVFKRLRKLTEIEAELKEEIAKDRTSEKVYYLIYELVYRYLMRSKKVHGVSDMEGIATVAAEDLYMKIYNGGEVNYWIGYIAKTIICSIKTYRSMVDTQIIDATNDSDLRDGIIRMSTSNSEGIIEKRNFEYDRILDSMFCESIPETIDSILRKICRYNEYSREFFEIRTAIVVSIITDREIDDFMIDEEFYPYYRFVSSVLKDKLKVEMDKDFENNSLMGNMTQIQIETMAGVIS